MEVTQYILSRYSQLSSAHVCMLVGVCGRAGAGKTTLANRIAKELDAEDISTACYSGDWRFILESETRKRWLKEKWSVGLDSYLNAINQFNWWSFEEIENDLKELASGHSVVIDNAYDRKSGKKRLHIEIPSMKGGIVLYENSVLGGVELLEELDFIVLLNTPGAICLERVIAKDSSRRSLTAIISRFLITTYSENIFFNLLLDKFRDKLLVCNSDGRMCRFPELEEVSQIPVPIPKTETRTVKKGAIFCDLDGTLIKHVPVPSETGEEIELLEGSVEKLKEWRKSGYLIILCTSRPFNKTLGILHQLESKGINFDQAICDLPVGPRYLINDSKGEEIRAFAFALERNAGIQSVRLP